MPVETPASLQAQIRTVFGVHAGAMEECEPWPASARSADADPAAYLDYCTHNFPAQGVNASSEMPVPTSVGDSVPWGGSFTDVSARVLRDGTVDASIIERPGWYRPHHARKSRESFGAGLKREEVMDPECRKRSARRAQVKIRRACSQITGDRIITHTFRDNVTDQDLAWRVWADFLRLYKAEMPYRFYIGKKRYKVEALDYCCVPEYQKRGSIHFHMVTNKPHCINRLRMCWQTAQARAGLENPDGNVNVRKQFTRQGGGPTNSQRCGRYLGKYLQKSISQGVMFRKRYSVSRGIPAPEVHRFYFIDAYTTEELLDFIGATFNVKLQRTGFGNAGPYEAAYATFVPP